MTSRKLMLHAIGKARMDRQSYDYHGTDTEIAFIRGLGGWALPVDGTLTPEHRKTRAQLLRNYRDAMALRVRWGTLDRERIAAAVDVAIEAALPYVTA
jgi:hypothetical protein